MRDRPDHRPSRPVASSPFIEQVGTALRDAREGRRERLFDIAGFLRIRACYLEALEDGDLERTPGPPYALGFMRSYANYLGYDGDAVVAQVREALDAGGRRQDLHYRTPAPEGRRPGGPAILASLLFIGVLYGGWHLLYQDATLARDVAAVPAGLGRAASGLMLAAESRRQSELTAPAEGNQLGEAAPAAAPQAGASRRDAGLQGPPATPPDDRQAVGQELGAEPLRGDAASALAAEPPDVHRLESDAVEARAAMGARRLLAALEAPEDGYAGFGAVQADPAGSREALPAPASATAAESGVTLVALESSWIQVRSADHGFLETRTMEAGERLSLPARDDLALWTGNAGGLEIFVDGSTLGVLGDRGAVERDVALSLAALRTRLSRE